MTNIRLHGILAKEFGNQFILKIRKAKDALLAIDANHSNFLKRITDLSKEGFHYSIIVDGVNIKDHLELEVKKIPMNIDIVPAICGSGGVAAAVLGTVAMYASTSAAISAGMALLLSTVGAMALSIGVQMMLAPDAAKAGKAPSIEVGGVKESFIFSGKANLIEQGSPVPVGYGRLRIGSNVISTSVKSYPAKGTVASDLTSSYLNVSSNVAQIIRK